MYNFGVTASNCSVKANNGAVSFALIYNESESSRNARIEAFPYQ